MFVGWNRSKKSMKYSWYGISLSLRRVNAILLPSSLLVIGQFPSMGFSLVFRLFEGCLPLREPPPLHSSPPSTQRITEDMYTWFPSFEHIEFVCHHLGGDSYILFKRHSNIISIMGSSRQKWCPPQDIASNVLAQYGSYSHVEPRMNLQHVTIR